MDTTGAGDSFDAGFLYATLLKGWDIEDAAAFGNAVVEHYLHAGRWEQFEYDRRVTDHELIRGFERA